MRQLPAVLLLVAVPLLAWAAGQVDPSHAPPSLPRMDAELGVPLGNPLVSTYTSQPPVIDGAVDGVWQQATPLPAPLHYGLHGQEPAGEVEMRSLYDQDNVYLMVRWPAATPGGDPGVWRNLATVHWRLVDPGLVSGEATGSDGLACTVACHTATTDGQGGLVGVRNETIPPGLEDDLPAAGGWEGGEWLIEWSRSRTSQSPYDQHLADPDLGYRFFVKLFQGLEGRADPVSDVHELRLGP